MAEINLSPYTAESEAIARKLRMAEALSQQANQPIELPQQPGVKVSHLAGLAKMLDAFTAGRSEREARQESKDLAENYRRQGQSEVGSFLEALQGTPAQAAIPASIVQNATGADAADNPNLEIMGGQGLAPEVPGQTAVGPDMKKALAVALGAQANPTIQAAGGALLSSMMKPAESAFAKINPKDYTKESVRAFMASGGKDMSLLDPLDKLHFQNTGTEVVGLNPYTGAKVATPLPVNVSVDTTARLQQERELSDRAFNGLSANQKATLANEGARLGISAADLYFNTGIKAGGVPNVGQPMAAPAQPMAQPTAQPMAGQPAQARYTPLNNVQSSDQNLPPKFKFEQMKNAPNQENTLRDEYNSLTKDFRIVQDAHSKIKNVANTGAGDMSLLYSYVKLLDPGSVVRESEFATAAASGSFGERIQGMAQRVLSGQRLPPDLRTDFIREADSIYTSQKSGADRLENQYRDIAKRNNLNPENIIVNYASPSGTALPPITSLKEGQITTFGNGQQWTLKNGKQVQVK